MRWSIVCLVLLAGAQVARAQDLVPPAQVHAMDTPSDAGGSISLIWPRAPQAPPGSFYQVWISEAPEGPFTLATEVGSEANLLSDDPAAFGFRGANSQSHFARVSEFRRSPADSVAVRVTDGRTYYFRVGVRRVDGSVGGQVVAQAQAQANLFNQAKLNNLILAVVFSAIILTSIRLARRRELYIRRIAGLEALDEALGRATEMGKPVLFVHGLLSMDSISTIAAVNILGRVARRTAEYDTALYVANNDPVVMSVSQEVVKEAYLEAGRPDAYNPDSVALVATEQFAYAAAVEGYMVRERPAAHIMMGYFYAESLLLTETGAVTGAIQIAGTDSYTQLPFFVTTCDYTLMGEELYAASAYLSREPRLLGSLKGQDIGKAVLILVLLVGTLLSTAGAPALAQLFTAF